MTDHKTVPREPTQGMVSAFIKAWSAVDSLMRDNGYYADECAQSIWRAMFDAAPAQPASVAMPLYLALTPKQAREIVEAWGGDEDEHNRIVLTQRDAWEDEEGEHHEAGLYLHFEEYPEEGVIGPLGQAAPAQPATENPTAAVSADSTKEQHNDDDGKGADRRQQGVRGVSVGAESGTRRKEDGQAGDVHDADDPRRAAGDRAGSGRFPHLTREWIAAGDDPPSCPHGVMAGPCPACTPAPADNAALIERCLRRCYCTACCHCEEDRQEAAAALAAADARIAQAEHERDEAKLRAKFYADDRTAKVDDARAKMLQAEARAEAAEKLHQELLYAVAQKFPGETRHQTALRYIRQQEQGQDTQLQAGQDTARARMGE